MKHSILFLTSLTLLTACNSIETEQLFEEDFDEEIQITDEDYAYEIDYMAGDPYDPNLPADQVGVSTENLISWGPEDVSMFLLNCAEFAKNDSLENPRFLFSIGRTAYFHGNTHLGEKMLLSAARNGSAAANAELARIYISSEYETVYSIENRLKAETHYTEAIRNGYQSAELNKLFKYDLSFIEKRFNKGSWLVSCVNNGHIEPQNHEIFKQYVTDINKYLWTPDALWFVEDMSMIDYLRMPLTKESTVQIMISKGKDWLTGGETHLLSPEAIQDARRLALMYNSDPGRFVQIYTSILDKASQL